MKFIILLLFLCTQAELRYQGSDIGGQPAFYEIDKSNVRRADVVLDAHDTIAPIIVNVTELQGKSGSATDSLKIIKASIFDCIEKQRQTTTSQYYLVFYGNDIMPNVKSMILKVFGINLAYPIIDRINNIAIINPYCAYKAVNFPQNARLFTPLMRFTQKNNQVFYEQDSMAQFLMQLLAQHCKNSESNALTIFTPNLTLENTPAWELAVKFNISNQEAVHIIFRPIKEKDDEEKYDNPKYADLVLKNMLN